MSTRLGRVALACSRWLEPYQASPKVCILCHSHHHDIRDHFTLQAVPFRLQCNTSRSCPLTQLTSLSRREVIVLIAASYSGFKLTRGHNKRSSQPLYSTTTREDLLNGVHDPYMIRTAKVSRIKRDEVSRLIVCKLFFFWIMLKAANWCIPR